jgi:hypothetical protein
MGIQCLFIFQLLKNLTAPRAVTRGHATWCVDTHETAQLLAHLYQGETESGKGTQPMGANGGASAQLTGTSWGMMKEPEEWAWVQ